MVAVDYNILGKLTAENEDRSGRQCASRDMGQAARSFLSLMAPFGPLYFGRKTPGLPDPRGRLSWSPRASAVGRVTAIRRLGRFSTEVKRSRAQRGEP